MAMSKISERKIYFLDLPSLLQVADKTLEPFLVVQDPRIAIHDCRLKKWTH